MVHITPALIFFAAIAPSFAAPLQAREPNLGVIQNAVHKGSPFRVGSAASAMPTSVLHAQHNHRRDFEEFQAREPHWHIGAGALKKAGRRIGDKVLSGAAAIAMKQRQELDEYYLE